MTAIIFIIVLSVIVFVHELGHFVMAKRAGMKVEEFGFGFPPRLWGYKPQNSETIYTINWIPFGGFVKILGEDGNSDDNRSFTAKAFWPRFKVIIAGVAMNFIFAAVIFMFVNGIGSRVSITSETESMVSDIKIQITAVAKGSPAEAAGLKIFDEIKGFETVEDFQAYIHDHIGQETAISLAESTVNIVPRVDPPEGEGALGIALAKTGLLAYPWHEAIWRGIVDAGTAFWSIVVGFAMLIKHIVTTGKAGVELAGPVGIAVISGQAARLGFVYLLQFVAFISLNLAVINIVPFPALDGGRLLFLVIEKIKGSPLPRKLEGAMNMAGFALLILLMLYITTKDVLKFF